MNKSNFRGQLMRLTLRDSLERMLAVVDMTLMFMYKLELVLTFAVKNQP
jgi:hypothetical protein